MNKNIKNCLMLLGIFIIVVLIGIFIASKASGTNYFDTIRSSISSLFGGQSSSSQSQSQAIPIKVTQNTRTLTTLTNSASFTFKTNQEVTLDKDYPRIKIYLTKKPKNSDDDNHLFWYVAEVSTLGIGDNTIIFGIKDTATGSQQQQLQVIITREGYSLPFGLSTIQDWPNSQYTADGDSLTAMVNKQYKLPMDYVPGPLVDIHADLLLYTNAPTPFLIRQDAGEALKLMASNLNKQTGKNLVITSAYRDYNEQYRVYANWVRQLGQEQADTISARPGFSEHQLGTAIDFVDQQTGLDLTNNFDKGVAGTWLRNNSYKYGFIQSYPEGKESITGYSHEAWHYRYIGIDNATKVHQSGLTLKEWLEKNQ